MRTIVALLAPIASTSPIPFRNLRHLLLQLLPHLLLLSLHLLPAPHPLPRFPAPLLQQALAELASCPPFSEVVLLQQDQQHHRFVIVHSFLPGVCSMPFPFWQVWSKNYDLNACVTVEPPISNLFLTISGNSLTLSGTPPPHSSLKCVAGMLALDFCFSSFMRRCCSCSLASLSGQDHCEHTIA